ncbi:RusA family crossover junction endodeoxyribonuclease [Persephonella sp.]
MKTYYLSFVPPSKANKIKLNLRAYSKSGKRYIVPKDVSIKINKAIWELQKQKEEDPVIKIPVEIKIDFILPDRRKRDLDNIMKTLGDCLVYAGILEDDNLIFKQTLEKHIIKGKEGVIIKITAYQEKKITESELSKLENFKRKLDGTGD